MDYSNAWNLVNELMPFDQVLILIGRYKLTPNVSAPDFHKALILGQAFNISYDPNKSLVSCSVSFMGGGRRMRVKFMRREGNVLVIRMKGK